jgi:peptide/nickel transport system permease protein
MIAARIPQLVVVVIVVTMLAFILVNILPGNVLYVILGDAYTKQTAAALSQQLGLNHPLAYRYFEWLWHAMHFNFGTSLTTHLPVTTEIKQNILPTVELVIGAQVVATVLGVVFAVASVATRIAWIDRLGTGIALFATSMPAFVLALIVTSIFAVHWHLIPTIGWANPSQAGWGANIRAIATPAIILGLSIFPGHMRIFRSELYEQIESEEYVTFARMKGVSTWRLMTRHLARNSAFGLITVVAVGTGTLIAGAVILENIFAIPGIGTLLLQAIQQHDSPVVEGCLSMIAVAIVVLNLIADLSYALLDPRVRDAQQR